MFIFHVYIHVFIYAYIYVYICLYVYIMFMFMFMFTHPEKKKTRLPSAVSDPPLKEPSAAAWSLLGWVINININIFYSTPT